MSCLKFAEVIFSMSEKTANPLEQFVLLAKTAKVLSAGTFRLYLNKFLAGRSSSGVDQTGLGGTWCFRLRGTAGYVKCTGETQPTFSFCNISLSLSKDLENGPHASYLNLLNTFAYGNYRSLMDNKANLPELSDVMVRKLRLLTMVI